MDSVASRIVKARQYAKERDKRVKVRSFRIDLHGENANHSIIYDHGHWNCDCEEFRLCGVCAHIMAMERILGDAVETAIAVLPTGKDAVAGRIVKARQYAEERDQRIKMHRFDVELYGDNSNHIIAYNESDWACDCEEFRLRHVCAHVMAMEEILGDSVEPALYAIPVAA